MKTYMECVAEAAAKEDMTIGAVFENWYHKTHAKILEAAADIYSSQSNSHKHGVSGKRPTPELFCKVHSEMYGETIDKLRQLDGQIFDGEELYELCLNFYQAACASGAVDKTVSVELTEEELKWLHQKPIDTTWMSKYSDRA